MRIILALAGWMLAGLSLAACAVMPASASPVPTDIQPTVVLPDSAGPAPTDIQPTVAQVEQTAMPDPTQPASGSANADVQYVYAEQQTDGAWTFNVTVAHPDSGWDDYADGWDVVLPDGTVVRPDPDSPFTRLLLHPHETEQPFTRSQSGIAIPADVTQVTVRAHDLVDGFGGREVVVDLAAATGADFEVVTVSSD